MTTHTGIRTALPLLAIGWLLRLATAAGLAIDAYVHLHLADGYDAVRGSISQGDLFRIQGAVAAGVAVLVLLMPTRLVWALAFLVAAVALGAVLLYRYVDVGPLGPLPNMYEPTWQPTLKAVSAIAEGVTVVTAFAGFTVWSHLRRPRGR